MEALRKATDIQNRFLPESVPDVEPIELLAPEVWPSMASFCQTSRYIEKIAFPLLRQHFVVRFDVESMLCLCIENFLKGWQKSFRL
jgi:hypothetical protein